MSIEAMRGDDPAVTGAATTGAGDAQAERLPRIIERIFARFADRPAFATRDGGPRAPYATVSYGEIWRRVTALVAAWRSELDPGDFVAILGFTSADFVTVDLATTLLGAPNVPLQAGAPAARIAAILDETRPKVFAVSADQIGLAEQALAESAATPRVVVFDGDHPGYEGLENDVLAGEVLPAPEFFAPEPGTDPLVTLIYTSGSTGTPKGAMYTEQLVSDAWLKVDSIVDVDLPSESLLHFLPMSHMYGRNWLIAGLASGGTGYFAAAPDMSSLFDDLAAARPTAIGLVPRVCELIHQRFLAVEAETDTETARAELRDRVLGGRVQAAMCGSAALSAELQAFMEWLLGIDIQIGYGSTEAGGVLRDGVIVRPPVTEYKLVDVPELGYFVTDSPHPRGELLVKSTQLIPGYYHSDKRIRDDEGFYHTGDVMAELAPDHLEYVDRRSNVIKLAQGEFVPIAQLEATYAAGPEVHQVFLHGSSERSYLLGVVVPAPGPAGETDAEARTRVLDGMARIARENDLASYEVPRDVIVEREPFSQENGLRSGIGKLVRPALVARYGAELEAMYAAAEERRRDGLRSLDPGESVAETVIRAAALTLGVLPDELDRETRFLDLGGDSLSALSLATTLEGVYGLPVPVQAIVGPTATLGGVAAHIEAARSGGPQAPTAASIHGQDAELARASDLRLERFIDPDLVAAAPSLPAAHGEPATVLLTGGTGYLGRFLLLEWLRRVAPHDGTVVALVRGADADDARRRVNDAIGTADPALTQEFTALAERHLEVVVGDFGAPSLGLGAATWEALAERVDHVVHCGAMVNHVLPYDQLFGPNVVGTAEIVRLALTVRRKSIDYVSTVAVVPQDDGRLLVEDDDVRVAGAERRIGADAYANGYAVSKWAGEVLLREASDLAGIPVRVFRSDMILAHSRFRGQYNPVDQFTRLLLSIAETGLAPASFAADPTGPRPHYDGLPVDFTAEAITTLGAAGREGFRTFHVLNVDEGGAGLDDFVDWIAEDRPIERIADYDEWFSRFENALRALPTEDRQRSVLPLLHSFAHPTPNEGGSALTADRFRAAVREANVGPGDIPHLDRALIERYLDGFTAAGWLA
ncbi:carboxylic acid reductase [Tsukamurella paurometabola]|uniref:Linear gramicidin synthase subunit D n=1 Tax=Tsukamurella paurometabola TaxID=2061 RepID=A0A3P8LHL6_TSUPA|nr:carboxylic acid reductase [Tsukamurella paurometabola]UEA84342.1 thioester reductase domain-containing protein [Tsukamurella paurometabola]VDR41522.1 Linear gramicidin synthase subunit D [Tsukamurella paurometabola]